MKYSQYLSLIIRINITLLNPTIVYMYFIYLIDFYKTIK